MAKEVNDLVFEKYITEGVERVLLPLSLIGGYILFGFLKIKQSIK